MSKFLAPPKLENSYLADEVLQSYLRRTLTKEVLNEIESDLINLGELACKDMAAFSHDAEMKPPNHIPYDAYGQRVDRIEVSHGWKMLRSIAAKEGLVAIPYENKNGAMSRVHHAAVLYLYSPWSSAFTCETGMTDGAACLLNKYADSDLKNEIMPRLISRDPSKFWTCGQWMTELSGGSDISGCDTIAKEVGPNQYQLYGHKNFVSAIDGDAAVVLARAENAVAGGKGLSLFFVSLRDEKGNLQGVTIDRLKNKLGTRAVPTAELVLNGIPAVLIGEQGNGVRKIATMLNITRLHNSLGAIGYLRRGILLARSFSKTRKAFGRSLSELPLHLEVLSKLQVEFEGAFHLSFRIAELAGRDENSIAGENELALRRFLTSIAKMITAKISVAGCSEILECFGGTGYLEDTGLPCIFRDAQVTPIWEGTTNVLSLEALKTLFSGDTAKYLLEDIERLLASAAQDFKLEIETIRSSLQKTINYCKELNEIGLDETQSQARLLTFAVGRAYIGALMINHAVWSFKQNESNYTARIAAAKRWCKGLSFSIGIEKSHLLESRLLGMGN